MNTPVRLLVSLWAILAVAGVVGFGIASGTRGAVSFLAGLAVATAIAAASVVMVEFAGRISPTAAMIAAMTNYALTVLVFVIVFRSVGPDTADIPAFAMGLAASVIPYLAWQFAKARPGR